MNVREISGATVAYMANVTDGALRAYRTSYGFLNPFGEMRGVGYLYSRDEALKITVAIVLGQAGLGLREAFEVIADEKHKIHAAFAKSPPADDLICRFERRGGGPFASLFVLKFNASDAVRLAAARLDEALASNKTTKPVARAI